MPETVQKPYEAGAWFWRVGEDETRVWSERDGAYVDIASIADWIADGGVPAYIDDEALLFEYSSGLGVSVPATLPQVVTMRQARLALHGAGLLSQVNEMMADADPAVSIEWEYATEVRRDHPMIAAMGQGLGLAEDDIDALFIEAAAIP